MSTHKINQIKVRVLLVLTIIVLSWTFFQITPATVTDSVTTNHIPAAEIADGGHAIDVG